MGEEPTAGLTQNLVEGFPGGSVVKNPPANAEDLALIAYLGRSHTPRSN